MTVANPLKATYISAEEKQALEKQALVVMHDYASLGQLTLLLIARDRFGMSPVPANHASEARFDVVGLVHEQSGFYVCNRTVGYGVDPWSDLTYTQGLDAMTTQMKAERDWLA